MPITYSPTTATFTLSGGGTSMVLHTDASGALLCLHWGARVPAGSIVYRPECYRSPSSDEHEATHKPWALPSPGRGFFGAPALRVLNADGDDISDLIYVSHRIVPGKPACRELPGTYTERDSEADTLIVLLRDALTGLTAELSYTVYADSGAIATSVLLRNEGTRPLTVLRLASASVLLRGADYHILHLKGAWARERSVIRTPLGEAEYAIGSRRGFSGQEENPFLALCAPSATEHNGEVYAMSLVYSGSFRAGAEVDNRENTRMTIGLEPDVFRWLLEPGTELRSPEAVLVYSSAGLNGMSHCYHELYRTRLARGVWRDKDRPVLINNWEGTYFDFDEERLISIAEKAKQLGVELFVLDDGWFGRRDSDNSSLGDWTPYLRKLPCGTKGLGEQLHGMGLLFGLWLEPEMVSPDSELYRAHPDRCLHVEGRSRTEARNQLVLDLCRPEVQDYIIEAVSNAISEGGVDYIKWDKNRNLTEAYSVSLPPERRLETQHRYMLGLYRILDTLTRTFPNVLFECCASGGGRFDPGMLAYMPQTWTSDDTDAVERLFIQYGTSMVYPACAMGAHVSAVPNHQTGRSTSLSMRGAVAIGGSFGFELDLTTLSEDELAIAADLVRRVKQLRTLTRTGRFTRLLSPFEGQVAAWQFTSEDGSELLLCVYRILARPNMPPIRVRMTDLCDADYRDDEGRIYSGAALRAYGLWIDLDHDFTSTIIHMRKAESK